MTQKLQADYNRLHDYILAHAKDMLKEPRGYIRYPFIDPGSVYNGNVWDWDTYWSAYGLMSLWDEFAPDMQEKILLHTMGNVRNFFDHQLEDGYIPMMIVDDGKGEETYLNRKHKEGVRMNMMKPFLACQTLLASEKAGSADWAKEYAEPFRCYLDYYDTYFHEHSGLYVWHDDIMIGMDNDPASFGRPQDSAANIFLNAFMIRELEALRKLYEAWQMPEEAAYCDEKRRKLIDAVQAECWDERDGFFYSVDVDVHTRPYDWFHKGLGVFWKTLPIRIRVWSGFIPLYAGIATKEQAEKMLAWAQDEATFASPYGIRTLARNEKMYNLSATNNPSNWLGPIWLIANYVVCMAMHRCGFTEEAQSIAARSVHLLGKDLEQHGCLHEYYNPETGEPVMNGGFINWNVLALSMAKETGLVQ